MIKGVRYYSALGSCGYGDAALTYMKGLLEHGVSLQWSPLIWTKWGQAPWHLLPAKYRPALKDIEVGMQKKAELMQSLEPGMEYDTVIMHCAPELWPKLAEPGKVNIGYTVWETDRLPHHWPKLLSCADHICVPCDYNQELFSVENGPVTSVVPHAIRKFFDINSDKSRNEFKRELGIQEGMYVFYIIAAWDPRKAMIETLQAFLQEFSADDNVCLLIKTDKEGCLIGHSGMKRPVKNIVNDILAAYTNPAKIVLIADRIPERQIQLIHEIGDCFYSLTHCEGWGLGAFDAAASGNPVIITAWGGQLDYLPEDSSFLVRYVLRAVNMTGGWESYDSGQKWAYADTDDAGKILRYCYQNQKGAKEKGLELKAFVNEKFSVEQVTRDLLRAISDAHSR